MNRMNTAISNIAWIAGEDEAVYAIMSQLGIEGLEIAPTRFFPEAPYSRLEEAAQKKAELASRGFTIPSMQSIWFGRSESLCGTESERQALTEYTLSAIDFAKAIGCRNLVFGCPRNRNIPYGADTSHLVPFFRSIAEYALLQGCVIGMEANPPIYNTNYINTTQQALELIAEVDSPSFGLNLDVGTMIHNGESAELLRGQVQRISHVHISEPGLNPIVARDLHRQLIELLKDEGYKGFVSLEMGKGLSVSRLCEQLTYLKRLCA